MLSLGTRRTRRFHRSPVGQENLVEFHSSSQQLLLPPMCNTATRRRSARESYVSLSFVTCHCSRQDDAYYTSAGIDHRVSSAFIDHQRGEWIENETCTRGKKCILRGEIKKPVLPRTRVSPPPRVQQSEYLTLASHVRLYLTRSRRASTRVHHLRCPVLLTPPRQVANRMSEEEGALSSSRTRSPQLSSARPNASPYYPRLAIHRRLHWRRALQAEATLASTLLAPCNPRLARAPPYAAIRAHPAGASAVSGETYILCRAESTTEEEGEKRACDASLRDAMRGGAPHEPTRSKQLCRRDGRAATERDDG